MVYAFLTIDVLKRKKVIYNVCFDAGIPLVSQTPENERMSSKVSFEDDKTSSGAENRCLIIHETRNLIVDFIYNHVLKEYERSKKIPTPSPLGYLDVTGSSLGHLDVTDESQVGGTFPLFIDNNLSNTCKIVFWHTLRGFCYVLVCEQHENRLLAIKILKDILCSLELQYPIKDKGLNAEVISTVVDAFLPNGQLQFMHNRVIKMLRKNVEHVLCDRTSGKYAFELEYFKF
ncbi:uncharacterized protein LOC111087887 [Limulus polyphemus]|uniref:Uncharacterized protein LOC111087887 n=1 Tax=Limulus polyphemus TaxID=6850 RepID=A0ABM1T7M7_LIMPO|nr:uncharacterized protein LOC111087887 [Limulus polyphemus]